MRQIFPWLLLAAALAQADSPLSLAELKERLKFYQSIEKLTAKFHSIKTVSDMNLKLESAGMLTLFSPDLVEWKIEHPSSMKVLLDSHGVRVESEKGTDATEFKGDEFAPLLAWLRLDPELLNKHYSIYSAGTRVYRFDPKNEGSPFRELVVTMTSEGHVKKVRIYERSNDSLDITFEKPSVWKKKK